MSGDPRSILVVRYSALGDLVLATSVLDPLRRRFPEARIEWITAPGLAPLVEGLPGVAAVHRLERRGANAALPLAARLRGRFDLAIDLQNKLRGAVVARAAAPRRLSWRRRSAGEALRALFGRDAPVTRAHATTLYAEALAPLGITTPGRIQVSVSPRARELAAAALAAVDGPAVAVAPGASKPTKRWAAERFAAVADGLAALGLRVVLAGGPTDREAFDAFRRTVRAPVAADLSALPVDALAAAFERVKLVVSCDSGPAHLATAVGTPVLTLFGPTSPARWGPPAPGRALSLGLECSPCSNHGGQTCPLGHHRCLADLAPARVLAEAREMLAA